MYKHGYSPKDEHETKFYKKLGGQDTHVSRGPIFWGDKVSSLSLYDTKPVYVEIVLVECGHARKLWQRTTAMISNL